MNKQLLRSHYIICLQNCNQNYWIKKEKTRIHLSGSSSPLFDLGLTQPWTNSENWVTQDQNVGPGKQVLSRLDTGSHDSRLNLKDCWSNGDVLLKRFSLWHTPDNFEPRDLRATRSAGGEHVAAIICRVPIPYFSRAYTKCIAARVLSFCHIRWHNDTLKYWNTMESSSCGK